MTRTIQQKNERKKRDEDIENNQMKLDAESE